MKSISDRLFMLVILVLSVIMLVAAVSNWLSR